MTRKIVYPDAEQLESSIFTGTRLSSLESLGEFEIFYGNRPDDQTVIKRCDGANAIISGWGVSNTVIAALPQLELIAFTGLGASTFIDLKETSRRGISVTHCLSAAEAIAEHTLGLMLDVARHITRLDRDIRKGHWNTEISGSELRGKTLGLIGFGRIAQAVVPLAKAFGMNIVAWTRNPNENRAKEYGINFMSLEKVLSESDIISLHLASNAETENLITEDHLSSMKPGAMLINTARSQILDEAALIKLLKVGHLAGAGIDVFDEEPLSKNHPFLDLDNVVLTPHVAYNTPEALNEMYDTVIENLINFYAGNPQNIA
jgi:D-3-phosphoglycerate dehydrogenase